MKLSKRILELISDRRPDLEKVAWIAANHRTTMATEATNEQIEKLQIDAEKNEKKKEKKKAKDTAKGEKPKPGKLVCSAAVSVSTGQGCSLVLEAGFLHTPLDIYTASIP